MEREIFFSGLGGQGVQLAARTLAVAATQSGLDAMMFGTYSGAMRGGTTDATVIISTDRHRSPPVIDHGWAAFMMHPQSWHLVGPKLRPNGFLFQDESVFRDESGYSGTIVRLPASSIASEAGMKRAGSMVALGAFVAATGIVSREAIEGAARVVLPPYRSQFIEANIKALALGRNAVEGVQAPAWDEGVLAA